MTDIRYRPPRTTEHHPQQHNRTPALWNPNAAALWSVLLSPAFGAILHMLNARALDHDEQRNANLMFLIAYGIVIAIGIPFAIAYDISTNFVGIGMTIGWYLVVGRKQIQFVAEKFGTDYPRKPWLLPIILGILGILLLMGMVIVCTILLATFGLIQLPTQ